MMQKKLLAMGAAVGLLCASISTFAGSLTLDFEGPVMCNGRMMPSYYLNHNFSYAFFAALFGKTMNCTFFTGGTAVIQIGPHAQHAQILSYSQKTIGFTPTSAAITSASNIVIYYN